MNIWLIINEKDAHIFTIEISLILFDIDNFKQVFVGKLYNYKITKISFQHKKGKKILKPIS